MSVKMAVQLYLLGDELKNDMNGTFKKLKESGYDAVEACGFCGKTAAEFAEAAKHNGLEIVCAHVGMDTLESDEKLEEIKNIGLKYVAIGWFKTPQTEEEAAENIKRLKNVGELCKKHGLQFLYHNHEAEVKKILQKTTLEQYYGEIPEDVLKAEIDTGWVAFAGEDPIEILNTLGKRVKLIHVKDYRKMSGVRPPLGAPVGTGILNNRLIIETAIKNGIDTIIAEPEDCGGFTNMEAIIESGKNIKKFLTERK